MLPKCYLGGGESEWGEREIAQIYTPPSACVLEFGGGAGSVSAVIQGKLDDSSCHTVIQPADGGHSEVMMGGLEQLNKNKASCNFQFNVIDRVLQSNDSSDILHRVNKPYDTIVADCEGCLVDEENKNPELFWSISMIQVERDDGGTYDALFNRLGLKMVEAGVGKGCDGKCNTEVWVRPQVTPDTKHTRIVISFLVVLVVVGIYLVVPKPLSYMVIMCVLLLCFVTLLHSTEKRPISHPTKPYRLGDIIKYHGSDSGHRVPNDHVERYKDSIGALYIANTAQSFDIPVLTRIVARKCSSHRDEVVIHLRLGDVLCSDDNDKFPPSVEDFASIINSLIDTHTPKVLLSGNHSNTCISQSKRYLQALSRKIPNLTISDDAHPDDDFCRMMSASVFVAGRGGFSEMVLRARKHLNRPSIEDDRLSGYVKDSVWYRFDQYASASRGVRIGNYNVIELITTPVEHVLHVGAHEAEEEWLYNALNVDAKNVHWIEANPEICERMRASKPSLHYINAVVTDVDGEQVKFNIANNTQSSSIFELGTHKELHPEVHYERVIEMTTKRIDSICSENKIDRIDFLHLDIQGAELKALKGISDELFASIQYINTEVSREAIYDGGAMVMKLDDVLESKGFQRTHTFWATRGWGDAFYVRVV